MFKKISIHDLFHVFLASHLIIWTLVPTFSNVNLPLDTIEALAWGSNLDWGYNKHPPISALLVEIFYFFFGNNDWAFYLLSQLCVIISFIYVWKLSKEFLKKSILSISSILILAGIYFYNFTTPEFNVNVGQLPFWSASIYYSWKCFSTKNLKYWFFLGTALSLGFLTKYIFIALILAIKIFFLIELIKIKKVDYKFFIPGTIFLIFLIPHLIWLVNNEFITISYAFTRSGLDTNNIQDHFIFPAIFLFKQIVVLIPFVILATLLVDLKKIKINLKDKKLFFLLIINFIPLLLIFLVSLIFGAEIRTMWMTPFYLTLGILIIYIFKDSNFKKNFEKFIFFVLFLFILSPTLYLYVSLSNDNKRTDYPGSEIADLVQRKWDRNFSNNIDVVVGDEWFAGNLSYHLESRPIWFGKLEENLKKINKDAGVIYTGNPKVLKKVCPGVYGTIRPVGYCMIGIK